MTHDIQRVLVTGGSGFIGGALTAALRNQGYDVYNLDIVAPEAKHLSRWEPCDILDRDAVRKAVQGFAPDAVLHLAARTDTLSEKLADYLVNTEGSRNVIDACVDQPSVQRFVFTSSQFVYGPFGLAQHDEDFRPHTVYGESKILSERYLRQSSLSSRWTIVRPTNIWGPRHPRYPQEFWRVLARGFYVHPKGPAVVRSYGYVGTVVDQYIAILQRPVEDVDRRVFYLGDEPAPLLEWVNGFSIALTGQPVREVPIAVLRALAWGGDIVQKTTGRPAPITSSRLQSMTQSYLTPMGETFKSLGRPKRTLQEGIRETVQWLRESVPEFVQKSERES